MRASAPLQDILPHDRHKGSSFILQVRGNAVIHGLSWVVMAILATDILVTSRWVTAEPLHWAS